MTSVVSNRPVMQVSILLVLVLTGALLVGCSGFTFGPSSPATTTTTTDGEQTPDVETPVEEGPPLPEEVPGETEETPA